MSSFFRLKVKVSASVLAVVALFGLACFGFSGSFIETGICVDSVLDSILKSIVLLKNSLDART